jgi:hypothetical protein
MSSRTASYAHASELAGRIARRFDRLTRRARDCLWVGFGLLVLASPVHSQVLSPRRLVEVADLAGPTISPDGNLVAFRVEQPSIARNVTDTIWYVQVMDGSAPPYRIGEGGVALRDSAGVSLPATAVWSPDNRWIYYRALIDGKVDVWRAAADGSHAAPVTHEPADVRSFVLSPDGRSLAYTVGASRDAVASAEVDEYDRGIRIDQSVPLGQPLFRSGAVDGRLATQRYGPVWFDRAGLLADVPDRWRTVDLLTGDTHDASPPDFGAEGRTASLLEGVIVATAVEPATGRIAVLARSGGEDLDRPQLFVLPGNEGGSDVKCRAVSCASGEITGFAWRPGTDDLLFTVTSAREGIAQSLHIWNVRTGQVRLLTRSGGLINGGRALASGCGVSREALACVAAEADRPPRLERIDLHTGRRRLLFDPNETLARDIAAIVPSRLLRWVDDQGREYTGRYFAARKTTNALSPLFITYYSCSGFLRGGVGDEWPLASLAEEGISALCINQPADRPTDRVIAYDQALKAIESGVGVLVSRGEVDPRHIGMGGLSYGSAVTLWVAANSGLVSAASLSSPIVSPNYYLFGSLKGDVFSDGLREIWGLGAPDETPERWRVLSPVFNLDRLNLPILMQMPEQEYMQALDYAVPLIRSHRGDLYVFPNEPHQKFQPRHKLAAYERNLDWFRFWLQDYENSDPSKAEQYLHWREMRAARDAGEE